LFARWQYGEEITFIIFEQALRVIKINNDFPLGGLPINTPLIIGGIFHETVLYYTKSDYHWPSGLVPYVIQSGFTATVGRNQADCYLYLFNQKMNR